jgi:hypothetical protein
VTEADERAKLQLCVDAAQAIWAMKVLGRRRGPAGLYFLLPAEEARPGLRDPRGRAEPADATFGFGVVFSDRALEFLRADDPATYDADHARSWSLGGSRRSCIAASAVVIDGIGFAAIGRLHFLR